MHNAATYLAALYTLKSTFMVPLTDLPSLVITIFLFCWFPCKTETALSESLFFLLIT